MKRVNWIFLALALTIFITTTSVSAQDGGETPGRDPVIEQEIYGRLAQINPDAVPIFQTATRDMDAGDLLAARRGYERVLQLAPDFPDAARRLSYVDLRLDDVEAAIRHAEQAYTVDPSPFNESALAQALLASEDPGKLPEALAHARSAVEALPDDIDANIVLLWAAAMSEDLETLRTASSKLVEIAPDFPLGHFYAGLMAAEDGRWELAERELLISQELGMPAEDVEGLLDEGIRSQARIQSWLRRGAYTLGIWIIGLGTLFLTGVFLSRLTLRAIKRRSHTPQFEINKLEHVIRGVYRAVITVTSVYFYLSIPILILVVVAAAGGVVYLFLVVGVIPERLFLILGLFTLTTLYVIIRSLFVRVSEGDPGRPLLREEGPHLWILAEKVAGRLGARPIEAIFITPGTEIAVFERGGMWKNLRGKGQRSLILGLGALHGLSQGQFEAILAHEYGHFTNRDTAGGYLAQQVLNSMNHMALGLALNRLPRWLNPAWWFIYGFHVIFLRITLGASRLQEVLADRYAVVAFGLKNFTEGLVHLVHQSVVFQAQLNTEIGNAQQQGRKIHNVYTLPLLEAESQNKEVEEKISEAMNRATSPYDSHPAPRERIALLEQLTQSPVSTSNPAPVWNLLRNAEALQMEMTALIQANANRLQQLPGWPHGGLENDGPGIEGENKFKVGDSVIVKSSVIDPLLNIDMVGWQGRISEINESDNTVWIIWDSLTLDKIPGKLIGQYEKDDLDWRGLYLDKNEVELANPRDTEADVVEMVRKLEARHVGRD